VCGQSLNPVVEGDQFNWSFCRITPVSLVPHGAISLNLLIYKVRDALSSGEYSFLCSPANLIVQISILFVYNPDLLYNIIQNIEFVRLYFSSGGDAVTVSFLPCGGLFNTWSWNKCRVFGGAMLK